MASVFAVKDGLLISEKNFYTLFSSLESPVHARRRPQRPLP
jgi:hypothetical protein